MIILQHTTKNDIIGNFVPDKKFDNDLAYRQFKVKEFGKQFKQLQYNFRKSLKPS